MKIKLGITIGDLNGIGPEILIKAVSDPRITDICTPVIYASAKVLSYHRNIAKVDNFFYNIAASSDRIAEGKINLINCWTENVSISIGNVTKEGGKYAKISLDSALYDLKEGKIDAIVTSPINKKAMSLIDFGYKGHTDYISAMTGCNKSLMIMINEDIKVALQTHHVPLADVSKNLSKEKIMESLESLYEIFIRDFDKEKPLIAVLGLNPHAGDDGVIGNEENEIIIPAIEEAKKKGIFVNGPFPSDSFWGTFEYKKYDVVLAMYHDQALIPFKILAFVDGVNFTGGLDFIRTSPDHGTGYDIAGKNIANHQSFLNAIFAAVNLTKNRIDFRESRKNALIKRAKPSEEIDE
ncbi:MAG: 4-hydroxythreonine-4-phosphate dehydrogenase PdxA [Deltaproteobacteria bacterium]